MTRKFGPILLLIVGLVVLTLPQLKGCNLELDKIEWNFSAARHEDAWVIFIEESSSRDLDFAILLQNKKWIDSLEQRKIDWRVYDKDQDEARSYLKFCEEYPTMLFVTPKGKMIRSQKVPKTSKGVDEVIKKVVGK